MGGATSSRAVLSSSSTSSKSLFTRVLSSEEVPKKREHRIREANLKFFDFQLTFSRVVHLSNFRGNTSNTENGTIHISRGLNVINVGLAT